VYLRQQNKPIVYTLVPMLFMLVMTSWAMYYNMRTFIAGGMSQLHLTVIGALVIVLELWMLIEGFAVMIRGREPTAVPALD
jgi:carbon starvation protein